MIENILRAMGISTTMDNIQKIQTEHRISLIQFWGIPRGARVLEIGCGQGDTLAALAFCVGESGFVHGVDIADENYGAPETLGQARERLLHSELGEHISIDLNFDILDETVAFQSQEFDYIVLSHCLWYLSSYDELKRILKRIKPWGKFLCLAEWNPSIEFSEQLPHLKAVTVQATCECFKENSESNVRTLFYPKDIEKAMIESGWLVEETGNIYSPELQDGKWEVDTTLSMYTTEIQKLYNMPDKLKQLLAAEIEELKEVKEIKPLSVFCIRGINDNALSK